MRILLGIACLTLLFGCGGGEGGDDPSGSDAAGADQGMADIATLPGDTEADSPALDAGGDDSGTDLRTDPDDDADGTGTDTDADADADSDAGPCRGPGCECNAHLECDSGWCVLGFDGIGVCGAPCGACPDGWSCEWRQVSTGERAEICVPDDVRWCAPCAADGECGAGVCLTLSDGGFCAPPCGADDLCPAGAACRVASVENDTRVCAPPGNRCIGCTDVDGDGHIAAGDCGGDDCDDADPAVAPSLDEICDGLDNNCVDGVDEGWDFQIDSENCGACGVVCDDSRGDVSCALGECHVASCDDGFADCNGEGADGCEIDLFGPTGCGACPGDDGMLHGAPCGLCGSGTWECADGAGACLREGGPEVRNVCGGCAELEGVPGDRCGTCDTGLVLCDGTEATRCDGDLGEDADNGCGGCEPLIGRPGTRCGTCGSGTYICDGVDDAVCVGDLGIDAYNVCGGCASMPGIPGGPCGTCDTGSWACDGEEAMTCVGDDPDVANACGGCSTLSETPGTACGDCDDGEWTCTGAEEVTCEGATVPGPDGCPDPECEGRDEGRLGERCTVSTDCCSGFCPTFAPAARICSERCVSYAGCNASGPPAPLFCSLRGSPRMCAPDDWGNSCTTGGDCNGGLCLTSTRTGSCSYECAGASDCASDQACSRFSGDSGDIWACTDLGNACTEPTACNSGVCLTGPTADYCTAFCDPAWGCPAGYSCTTLPGDDTFLCLR